MMKDKEARALALWRERLGSRAWRLENLYWIKDKRGELVLFKPNEVQRKFLAREHKRNAILKARQLGMSTLMMVLIADFIFWGKHKSAAIIDWRLGEGKKKLGNIALMWEMLDYVPAGADVERRVIAGLMKEKKRRIGEERRDGSIVPVVNNTVKLGFKNGCSVYVDNTFRGGTLQFMHVSELAKMANKFPLNAAEVVNGGFESVGTDGFICVESTHEGGRYGINYELMQGAMRKVGKPLLDVDWQFHFFPWYEERKYRLDVPEGYVLKDETVDYFTGLRERYGVEVPIEAQVWWEWKSSQSNFNMKEEYPSVPDEAFDAIGDDAIYGLQFRRLRDEGRIGVRFTVHPLAPVYCCWDLGVNDHMAVCFIQKVGGECRVIGGIQAVKSCTLDMLGRIKRYEAEVGFRVSVHLMPHDSRHATVNDRKTAADTVMENGYDDVRVVPRTVSSWLSINEVREFLPMTVWHERCGDMIDDGSESGLPGILDCMESYRQDDKRRIVHDEASHFADSFRYFVEGACHGLVDGFSNSLIGMEQLAMSYTGAASCGVLEVP